MSIYLEFWSEVFGLKTLNFNELMYPVLQILISALLSILSGHLIDIMKTCPCNVHPLTPHFCIVKLGFTGVYIDCGYSLKPPHLGGSNVYPQSMF